MTRGQAALRKALELIGSKKALCKALWLSYDELEDYLSGKKPVPASVASAATDIARKKPTRPRS